MSKVTLLGMKVDAGIAENVLKLYEEQKDSETGTPYKGEFVGALFENAINAFVEKGATTATTPQPAPPPKPGFNYKLATGILLILVIVLAAILWLKLKSEQEDEA